MAVAFAYIYYILLYIGLNDEKRLFMASDIQSLSLAYCIELSAVMLSDYLSERICLVSCLLYVLAAASVGLCLKSDLVAYRL